MAIIHHNTPKYVSSGEKGKVNNTKKNRYNIYSKKRKNIFLFVCVCVSLY